MAYSLVDSGTVTNGTSIGLTGHADGDYAVVAIGERSGATSDTVTDDGTATGWVWLCTSGGLAHKSGDTTYRAFAAMAIKKIGPSDNIGGTFSVSWTNSDYGAAMIITPGGSDDPLDLTDLYLAETSTDFVDNGDAAVSSIDPGNVSGSPASAVYVKLACAAIKNSGNVDAFDTASVSGGSGITVQVEHNGSSGQMDVSLFLGTSTEDGTESVSLSENGGASTNRSALAFYALIGPDAGAAATSRPARRPDALRSMITR